ncbi:MAG: hypothetical protein PVG63_03850 [Anaerolineales bacterium]
MKRFNLGWLLPPIFLALYSPISLFSVNLGEIEFSEITRALLVCVILALALTIALGLLFRNTKKAAWLSSIGMILFFSYGHVYQALKPVQIGSLVLGRHRYLLPIWLLLAAGSAWVVHRKAGQSQRSYRLLMAFSIIVLALPLGTVALNLSRLPTGEIETDADLPPIVQEGLSYQPDIYYIIVDAYAREDILRDRFGYDNSAFIQALEGRGFVVAPQSHSNYLRTIFSLTSTLNLDYLQNLGLDLSQPDHREVLEAYLQHSLAREALAWQGYEFISMTSSYRPTEIVDADLYFVPDMGVMDRLQAEGAFNAYEDLLLRTTMLLAAVDYETSQGASAAAFIQTRLDNAKQIRREVVLAAFRHLQSIPDYEAPTFTFVHIVSPHYPYLFGPNGEAVNYPEPITFVEKQVVPGTESWEQYRDQLEFISSQLIETIDVILANSDQPPVIIIQSDHGPATGLNWEQPAEPYLTDRSSILNAYLLPQACQADLYDGITPVNSFRIVLNCVLGTDYSLLEDRTFLDLVNARGGLELIEVEVQ